MATAKKYTIDSQRKASAALAELPVVQKTELDAREYIAGLKTEIEAAIAKGHSLESIAGVLRASGVEIAPGTIKSYMRKSPSARKSTKPKKQPTATA